jgi:quercetin dioxygenase-like cupin family protein
MPAKKAPARKPAAGKIVKLRPSKPKSATADGVLQFSLQKEMLQVLGRVSGNQSKRTATALVDKGPIRAFMIALDEDATVEQDALDGNVSVQVLIGEVEVSLGRTRKRLHVGDLLVIGPGDARSAKAIDPSVLLITIAAGDTQ